MYSETTRDITVTVEPVYREDRSDPGDGYFVWQYSVRIENNGAETVRLRMRHWHITDAAGRTREVRGIGVVGEQPLLRPGETFEYASAAPLGTPSGVMSGSYRMEADGGTEFDVAVPAFSLDSPHQQVSLN